MTYSYLSDRTADGAVEFNTERAYCGIVGEFVSPMRADICNDCFELANQHHCEFYREIEGLE